MPHWSAAQHFDYMARSGVTFAPRYGDGTAASPWREADGSRPVRSPEREYRAMQAYLASQPGDHVEMLESLNAPLRAMKPECRIAVLLPCRNEAQHVGAMLDQLAEQFTPAGGPLPREAFEVLLLVNHVEGERTDDTLGRAAAWDSPLGLVRHVLDYAHPADEPCPLTMARKILADLAVLRAVSRGCGRAPLYFASEDADILWMDPCQIASMIAALDGDPGLDGVRGQQDRCPWIMVRNPLLLLMRRSWNFTEAHMARRSLRPDRNPAFHFNWNRVVASGWNTAFSAEAYALIGGYTRERQFEEDMDLGEKISCLRAYPDGKSFVPQVNTFGSLPSRSEGSPRRWFYRFSTGVEPYLDTDGYANFFRLDHEREVKFRTLDDFEAALRPATTLEPANVPLLTAMLQKDLDFLTEARGSERGRAEYGRILGWLGFAPGDVDLTGPLAIRSIEGPRARIAALARRLPPAPVRPATLVNAPFRRSWHGLWGRAGASAYRVGLVGCGRVVEEGHLAAYEALPATVAVTAVCDSNPARRDAIGERLGVDPSRRYGDLGAMLAEGGLHAVVIASPSATHAEAVRRCLDAGLEVLCEKPLAIGSEEARALAARAAAAGVKLGTLHNYLTQPLWARGLEILRSDRLGRPLVLRTRMTAPSALPGCSGEDPLWRHRREQAGRGCLLDQGYHLFYLSSAVFGTEVVSVEAQVAQSELPGRDVEDVAQFVLRHACGGETRVRIDWRSEAVEPTAYVIDCAEGRLVLEEESGAIRIAQTAVPPAEERVRPSDLHGYCGSLGASLTAMAAGFAPVTPATAAVETLAWIDEAYRSAGAP